MKVILATDSIFWPLTGIGKYTFELATRLRQDTRLSEVRFFNMGRWQEVSDFQQPGNTHEEGAGSPGLVGKTFGFLRKSLSMSKPVVKAYSVVTPYWYQQRLKPFSSEFVFHSPNFMLPGFSGKKVVTFHDLSIQKFPQFHPSSRVSYLKAEMDKSAAEADHIITDSEMVRQEVIEYFSRSPDEVTAIPLASSLGDRPVEPGVIDEFLSGHGLARRQFFLFVSSIEPRKNIDRVLDAFEQLPDAFKKNYPLVLTGSSGWKSGKTLERIEGLVQSELLRYLGYTSDAELKTLYSAAGALVFPSLYEGFGLPIIEAQAMGVPVVTSSISCMPEVSGGAALLVDPLDVNALKTAFERIMLDEVLRRELIPEGRKNAEKFSWGKTLSQTVDVYSGL